MAKEKKRKRRSSGRLTIFVILLLLAVLAVFLCTQMGSSSLRRFSYQVFDRVTGDGSDATIKFTENDANLYSFVDGKLAVISPNILSVYELSGSTSFSSPVSLRTPAVSSSESSFLAFDLGGLNYYLADDDEILFTGSAESKILNANLNESGDFTITTDSPDCKSLVTAYNSDYEAVYKFHSSEKYVFDAAISPDEKTIAIISYGTTEGSFCTDLSLCHTNEASFFSTISLGESMPLKISFISDDKLSVICDDRLLLYNDDGSLICEKAYSGLNLQSFSIAYDNHISVLLSDSLPSTKKQLLILDTDGNAKTLDITDDVFYISTAGKFTALMFENKCVVYKNDLTEHCLVETSADIFKCLANTDGSILLLSDNSATFFVK